MGYPDETRSRSRCGGCTRGFVLRRAGTQQRSDDHHSTSGQDGGRRVATVRAVFVRRNCGSRSRSIRRARGSGGPRILRIYEESYGTGAASAETLVGKNWVIVVLDGLELLPNEKFLVENGEQGTVMLVRTQYQHAIRSSFSAAIERATGRTVVGFASTTSIEEPRFMAEVFRLE